MRPRVAAAAAFVALLVLQALPAHGRTSHVLAVAAGDTSRAAALAIAQAQNGDTIVLGAGTHRGPLRIAHPIVLRGEPGAVVDGDHRGSVIEVGASGTRIEALTVRASGTRVIDIDSGIHVIRAGGVELRDVQLEDVLYGVYAERADQLTVEHCTLTGRVRPLDESGEGNGLHLWYCSDVVVRDNDVSRFVDAVFLSFVTRMDASRNRLHDNGRYGLHTMYCQENRFVENEVTRDVAGCALMFTNHVEIARNRIVRNRGPRTYGLLLRDCSDGRFEANHLVDNTVAIFMDGSNRNRIEGNLVQDNGWGILLFSSSAGNVFTGNDFINNDYPVALDMRRTDNRFDDGTHGNYWSDAAAFDLDGDGVSDVPFAPVSAFAFVSKQYPDLAVLAKSPAVASLAVAERVFPALSPSEAVDRFPRVRPSTAPLPRGPREVRESAAAAPAATPRAWGAAAAFAATGLAGLAGLVAGRRA
jgi:nitrous oxidase accessory protein